MLHCKARFVFTRLTARSAQRDNFATTISNKLDLTSSVWTSVSKPAFANGSRNLVFITSIESDGASPVNLYSQSNNRFFGNATGRTTTLPPAERHRFTSSMVRSSKMYSEGKVETTVSKLPLWNGSCCANPRVRRAKPFILRLASRPICADSSNPTATRPRLRRIRCKCPGP